MTLLRWLREVKGKLAGGGSHGRRSTPAQRVAATRPRLEELEERLTPTTYDTITNAAISITPNFSARTASETITATVTNNTSGGPSVTAGNFSVNVNNMLNVNGTLNSSGQGSLTFTLPLVAVAVPQTIEVYYGGATVGANTFNPSVLFSPVYLNAMNAFLPSTITFVPPALSQSSLPVSPFGTHNGESDDVAFIDFNYIDPGTMQTFTLFGFTLPGSFSSNLLAPFETAVASSTQLL
ncbi:MAG TPA: hypothetical protein VMF69_10460 [Gemmataceae bacterium]|nr:hypothetical protein [Gemmataceae bacterium]